jgi:hypothetical protein
MLIDRPQITETSYLSNAVIDSGTADPTSPDIGELFFRTDLGQLRVYNGSTWVEAGSTVHAASTSLHLSTAQNTLLDGLAPTLTATEINYLDGVTGPIQAQIDGIIAAAGSVLRTGDTMTGALTINPSSSTTTPLAVNNNFAGSFAQLQVASNDRSMQLGVRSSTNVGGPLASINMVGVQPFVISMNGVSEMTMQPTGEVEFAADVSSLSDRRLKKDIKVIEGALSKVLALEGVTFTRVDAERESTGLIAQQVQAVLPQAVHTNKDGMLSVSYGNVVGLLVEAIKELQAEVAALKAAPSGS